MRFQRNEDVRPVAPRPDAVLVYEREPKLRVLGQSHAQQPFIARLHFETNAGEHDAVVGDGRGEGDGVDVRLQQPGGFVAFELQGKLEGRLNQAISEIGRAGLEIALERARDALPFGGLQGCGQRVHGGL